MNAHLAFVSGILFLATFNAADAMAQSQRLSDADIARAIEIESGARSRARTARSGSVTPSPGLPALARTRAGGEGRSIVSGVTRLGSPGTTPGAAKTRAAPMAERAIVTRYDYASGVTTRTTVDLATGTALHTREDVNYPTPLAKEELDRAVTLARGAVPEFDAIVKSSTPETLEILHLAPVDTDPSSPRYGHRLVVLWIDKPKRSDKVLVDLSTEDVVPKFH